MTVSRCLLVLTLLLIPGLASPPWRLTSFLTRLRRDPAMWTRLKRDPALVTHLKRDPAMWTRLKREPPAMWTRLRRDPPAMWTRLRKDPLMEEPKDLEDLLQYHKNSS